METYNAMISDVRYLSALLNDAASYEMDADKRERYLRLWKWVEDTASSNPRLVRDTLARLVTTEGGEVK